MLKKKSIFNNWIFIDDAFYIYCFLPFLCICHLICYNIQKVDICPQNKTERISIYMREQLINMEYICLPGFEIEIPFLVGQGSHN